MNGFGWDRANVDHIAWHGLEPEEVEDALLDPEGVPAAAYNVATNSGVERRSGFIGATEAGRILYVAYTKRGGVIRVVTARDANSREKRSYR